MNTNKIRPGDKRYDVLDEQGNFLGYVCAPDLERATRFSVSTWAVKIHLVLHEDGNEPDYHLTKNGKWEPCE